MKVLEDAAKYELVKVGPHPKEIEAVRADIDTTKAQLDYYRQQVERTRLKMPFSGRIITLHLQQKVGQYLNKGDLFAVVEKDDSYFAEVFISEQDAAEVVIGAAVRLKSWSHPDKTLTGVVQAIDPVVIKGEFGSQVRIMVRFTNGERLLTSGMTGVAKIQAQDKPLWDVFSRLLVGFFSVEVWSWLP